MAESIIGYRGTVYPWQCDHMGHMNVMWYTNKFDEASWHLLSRLGLHRSLFDKECTGMAVVDQHIQHKRELHAGDLVSVRSSLLEVKETSIRLKHEMLDDIAGEVVATCFIVGVHFDRARGKSCPLPRVAIQRASEMIATGSEEVEALVVGK
jgi:acyl-CoA thioester hydrolase